MALATYKFPDDDSAKAAYSKICSEVYKGYGYDMNLTGEYIYINNGHRDPGMAATICQAYGGKPI